MGNPFRKIKRTKWNFDCGCGNRKSSAHYANLKTTADIADTIGEGQNAFTKKVSDIAETIGETERTTKRILKLNDLIPLLKSKEREVTWGIIPEVQLILLRR